MKINFDFLKKINKTFPKKFIKEGFRINPTIYWNFIILLFFIILISSFIFGYFLFKNTEKDLNFSFEKDFVGIDKGREEKINNVINYFNNREIKSKEIIGTNPLIKDPSF